MAKKADNSKQQQVVLHAHGLVRTFRMGGRKLEVLSQCDLRVKQGEWLAILGASGSGKSTLLHILGALDRPDRGQVFVNGQEILRQNGKAGNQYRNRGVGFVFQFYHLLPELTALQNVTVAGRVGRSVWKWWPERTAAQQRATELLESLGLGERLHHPPSKLSGGERQRVAIARALINQPTLLLADEPTGNLDAETGKQILDVFCELHRQGQTIIMVTHDTQVAALADRRLRLDHGKITSL